MRRTALVAGLVTALIGGAAAFAAAETAPTVTEPAPDPYLGSWALTIDGDYAGPVASVDDCNLQADVNQQAGPYGFAAKHVALAAPAPCTIEVGVGMSSGFNTWLSRSLAGDEAPHTMQLVRTDAKAYGLELSRARLKTVALPRIDRASTGPAFLKIGLAGETLRRAATPPVKAVAARGFEPTLLAVDIDGTRTGVTTFGPWKARVSDNPLGELRDYQRSTDVGNLPLRVTEHDAALIMEPWLQSFLVRGETSDDNERSVTLTLTDGKPEPLELKFQHAGLAAGDLAPRADGDRSYTLYAERFTTAAP